MKARAEYLGKWDLGILILCGMIVLLTIGAAGESGRQRAKEAVCQANLNQWGRYFQGYIHQNDGQFFTGIGDAGYWWPVQLPDELQDWKKNRTWFCPSATTPLIDEHGRLLPLSPLYSAWGIFAQPASMTYQGKTYSMNPNGLAGSYGLNGYVIPIAGGNYENGMRAINGWRNLLEVPPGNAVPMFFDALRFDLWPRETEPPAASEFADWSNNQMARCSINRHDGAVNCLFVDGSVRKVGLKELWTLKWHRSFNTTGPWTKAGGVLPYDWPQWMRSFKEY